MIGFTIFSFNILNSYPLDKDTTDMSVYCIPHTDIHFLTVRPRKTLQVKHSSISDISLKPFHNSHSIHPAPERFFKK